RGGNMQDLVLEVVARFLIPLIQLFGVYIVTHGHLSPGGGFSGGTIIGASFIFHSMVFRYLRPSEENKKNYSSAFEAGGALLYIVVGMVGIFAGKRFLTNGGVFPLGSVGRLFSSGMIAILSIGIGSKVAQTVASLYEELLEGGEEHGNSH
ncbi:MAG: MnhB domain-containing protein, partial [bacterium]|nr:MnhB domain-containing protein [bacterium]